MTSSLTHVPYGPAVLLVWTAVLGFGAAIPLAAQEPEASGEQLYLGACAACHGTDGAGNPQSVVGFETPLPDFSDCSFASREPDGDWLGVVREGGPLRAFDPMMPAFGDALSEAEGLRILGHVRTFCDDASWPRGELNLPRPLVTEKAFPEDESVVTVSTPTEDLGEVMIRLVHEKRFGPRSQIEVAVPFVFARSGEWEGGVGDMAFAFKHVLFHSLVSGSILSATAELVVPTGDPARGFGTGATVFEPFMTFGQILPEDAFVHFQGGFEFPAGAGHSNEAFWRAALGKTWTRGAYGRAWTPIVELLGSRDLEAGAVTNWDLVPQVQVSLPTRQHILLNVGVRTPLTDIDARQTEIIVYLLWDWFDGGLLDGW